MGLGTCAPWPTWAWAPSPPTPLPPPLPCAPPTTPTTPTTPTSKFTKTGVQWTFELPATGSLCYDIDTQAQTADCTGAAWDVKVTSSGRTAALYPNSGPSSPDGSGKGAALGTPFTYTWTQLKTYLDATLDPVSNQAVPAQAWIADSARR